MDPAPIDPDEDEPFATTTRPFAKPEALYPGARVRLIAPSGVFDRARFERGAARLAGRYDVAFDEGIFTTKGYFAGDDARRAAELEEAIADPLCQAIVCVRGGYGAMRIVPRVPLARLARRPTLLVGFSDVTALHVAWQRARVTSIHGPMVATLGQLDDALFDRWIRRIEGEVSPPVEGLGTVVGGEAEGVLVGGNLSILHALEGTPHSAHAIGRVVFLEDVGEAPYRVDRMLTTLRLSGFFDGVRAIVLGAFTKCAAGPDGTSVDEVLRERLGDLGVPVVRGVPAGHVEDNLEVPFGVGVRVEASATSARVTFLESPVRPHT
jgi:muramoyltetrapeptide carboxypeptidase